MNGLQKFLDSLAFEAFGMTKAQAHEQCICIQCGEKVLAPDLNERDWDEYLVSGLCPKCSLAITGTDEVLPDYQEVVQPIPTAELISDEELARFQQGADDQAIKDAENKIKADDDAGPCPSCEATEYCDSEMQSTCRVWTGWHCGRVTCYKCGRDFRAPQAQWDAWGNSGEDFDPTDWDCGLCSPSSDEPDLDLPVPGIVWDEEAQGYFQAADCTQCDLPRIAGVYDSGWVREFTFRIPERLVTPLMWVFRFLHLRYDVHGHPHLGFTLGDSQESELPF